MSRGLFEDPRMSQINHFGQQLQIIPAETVILAGEKQAFRVRSIDANGFVVENGARPKVFSNIIDDSPLQNQIQRNKECKIIQAF